MNNIQVYNFKSFPVRTVVKNGEPFFVAVDVCNVLGLGNTTDALTRIDEDERTLVSIEGASNGQPVNAVTEAGLYALVIGSRKTEAREFKRWITHEVLPTIRKTGGYVSDTVKFVDAYLPGLPEAAKLLITTSLEENRRLYAQIEQQKPMVTFAETCLTSKDSILVRELAKIACKNGIEIGEKRLWQRLREWGLVLNNSREPSQHAMNNGWFEVKEVPIETAYNTILRSTTKVTPKGQVYIIERLRKHSAN